MFFDDFDELKKRISASYEIVHGAGCYGIIAGQVADIEAENKECFLWQANLLALWLTKFSAW